MHTHQFSEVISDDENGLDRRCQCGARLWEPVKWWVSRDVAEIVLKFSGGNVVKRNGRLVFERFAYGECGDKR